MQQRLVISLLLLILGLGLMGCGKEEPAKPKEVTKEQLQKQAGELLDTAKQFLQQQKDKFLQDIEELQAKAEKAAPETKANLEAFIKNLQEKKAGIKKQLEDSKGAAGKAWEELKSGLDQKLRELDQEAEKNKDI